MRSSPRIEHDADARVREMAAWALSESGDRAAADALGDALSHEQNARAKGTEAWAPGHIIPRTAPRGLIDALSDSSDNVRLKAAWALSEIGDPAATPALRNALQHETSDDARRAEVRAILRSGEQSDSTFSELLQSKDAAVREAAVRGLAGGGMRYPWPWPWPRPRPWPGW